MKTSIGPNPANDVLHLSLDTTVCLPLNFTLFDALGKQCCSWDAPASKQYSISIPLATFPAGAYYLEADNGHERSVRSFIISR
jgi:hypothetical protein